MTNQTVRHQPHRARGYLPRETALREQKPLGCIVRTRHPDKLPVMQGFNMGRYVPPDQEGVTSGNRLLGVRAQKATAAGVAIVRFEMPFSVWCDGCQARTAGGKHPVLIGQGVRFNAEKHRTGKYYSTPIWTFRMRHPPCGTWLAIRTDPAHTDYVVESGGHRRRDYADEDEDQCETDIVDGRSFVSGGDADRDADRLDAFDRLERTIAHRPTTSATATVDDAVSSAADGPSSGSVPMTASQRITALATANARQWQDPYSRNRALRTAFRAGRHAREHAAAADDALRTRLGGLSEDLALLPPTASDAQYAALVTFGRRGVRGLTDVLGGPAPGGETPTAVTDRRTLARPLFDQAAPPPPRDNGSIEASLPTTSVAVTSSRHHTYTPMTQTARRRRAVRDHLAATVAANTRQTTDPFLEALQATSRGGRASGASGVGKRASFLGIKKKPSRAAVPDAGHRGGDGSIDHTDRKSADELQKTTPNTAADTTPATLSSAGPLVNYDSD